MQIVKYPPIYSPAFGEVVFQISAAAEELLELDILANDQTTVIGKKRFRGSTLYRVNVAGYGRRQIEVTPQRPAAVVDAIAVSVVLWSGPVSRASALSGMPSSTNIVNSSCCDALIGIVSGEPDSFA